MEFIRVEDCCEILDSQRKPVTESERVPGMYPYYGANGIQGTINQYIFDDKLVLVAEDGGHFGSKIKPIAYLVNGKCWVNNHAHVLRPKKGFLAEYICYSLMFYKVEGYINGATRQKLTQAALRKLIIPKRSLEYQKAIVDRLDLVKCIIEKKQNIINELELLIKSRFVDLFGDIELNDRKWKKIKFGELIKSANNGLARRGNNKAGNIVLRLIELQENLINYSDPNRISLTDDEKKRYRLLEGDLLFARVNGNPKNVGRCATFYEYGEQVYHNDHIIRTSCDKSQLDSVFAAYLFNSEYGKNRISRKIKTSAGQYTINQEGLKSIEIILPPIVIQYSFAEFVKQINKLKFD